MGRVGCSYAERRYAEFSFLLLCRMSWRPFYILNCFQTVNLCQQYLSFALTLNFIKGLGKEFLQNGKDQNSCFQQNKLS
jgi:hypothetical protein